MGVRTVGVLGAGVMGRGVCLALAQAGIPAVVVDISEEILERTRAQLRRDVRTCTLFSEGPFPTAEDVLSTTTFTTDYADLAGTDLLVENVTEKWEVKKPIYEAIDGICPPDALFCVNTSAIPITRVAGLTRRPDRVVGMHFMNPVPLKSTVEVIRGFHTSEETEKRALEFVAELGKSAIVVEDSPGFVTNRVMMLTVNEAIFLLQEQVASAAEIDQLFVQCFGHKMGPLETADLIGLDTVLLSIEVLREAFKDSKYRPSPLLCKMVDAGLLGRKSGKGFFDYGAASGPRADPGGDHDE